METTLNDVPPAFLGANTLPPSILDEALEEVKNQILRRYMGSFGSALSLTNGVDLYAIQVEGAKRIYTVMHTKPKPDEPPRRKKSITFGHTFEELEVMKHNRQSCIDRSQDVAKTTDELADMKKNSDSSYSNDLSDYAKTNHTQVDLVIFKDETGVQKTLQLKNTKNTNALLEDRYIFGHNAPDKIVVPSGTVTINGVEKTYYDIHKENLEKIIKDSSNEKKVALAQGALKSLKKVKLLAGSLLIPT